MAATSFRHQAALLLAAAAVLMGSTTSASADAISAVYVFGDSLSDNGNLFAATGGAVPQPVNYFQGRFSNGPVAVEVLAQGLGVGLHDYAYGGAQTDAQNGAMVQAGAPAALQNTGMLSQVGAYQAGLASAGAAADPNALYVVWGGANDFEYLGYTPTVAQSAIQNLNSIVQTLYGLGARNFLVPGLPDLGLTPAGLASGASAQLQLLSFSFNQGLTGALTQLRALPGIGISDLDTFGAQHAVIANPAAYGLSNVTDACFTGTESTPGPVCANPAGYFYWDDLHPTVAVHRILGNQMLAAVPEPTTMLLMATGVLGLLAMQRRQRNR